MVIDKEEHKQFLLEIINQVQFPGNLLEIAFELKAAIKSATIKALEES